MRIAWLVLVVAAACGTSEMETLTVTGTVRTGVTSDPAGISCGSAGSTCTAEFEHGTHVMLIYNPNPIDNTGFCPINGCSASPADAVVQSGCKEVVMTGPVIASFVCIAP